MTTPKLELRRAELRLESRGNARRLVGYAARYGVVADIGNFRERIAAGAFAKSVEEGEDILALLDHDPSRVLGRTRSKTLTLDDDDKGLAFEIAVPDTSAGRDALTLAERGDLGGASIG
ncbi:MAG: HK97 family phage prohead protease, partial [Pseudomonadota bacterium]